MMGALIDVSGQRFSRLLVIERVASDGTGPAKWLCVCDCGNKTIVGGAKLKSGHTRSCGCLLNDCLMKRNTTHGMSGRPEHSVWNGMIDRCHNPNGTSYARYGGRGITVCDAWKISFESFFHDMGPRPSEDHSIDRIDNNGGYSPENCRWATLIEQARNKERVKRYSFGGVEGTLPEMAYWFSIPHKELWRRIVERKWSLERAFTQKQRKPPSLTSMEDEAFSEREALRLKKRFFNSWLSA